MLLLCAGIAFNAGAQEKSVLLYGNFAGGYNSNTIQNENTDMSNNFGISFGVGYQISHYWTLGIEGNMNYDGTNVKMIPTNVTSSEYALAYGGGVFGRYTVELTPVFYFYAQADALYNTSTTHESGSGNFNGSAPQILEVMLTPNLGLNIRNGYALNFSIGSIGYTYENISSAKSTSSSINYNFGRSISIGISKNFIHHLPKPIAKPIESQGGPEGE